MSNSRRLRMAVGSAVALTLLAAACSSSVSASEVESQISAAIEDSGSVADDVSCPDSIPAEVGETMGCDVTVDGSTYGVTVKIDSVDGDVAKFSITADE